MLGVAGDNTCMHEACAGCTGGYTTDAERDSCPALVNKNWVQAALLARYGECVEHRPAPPPPVGTHAQSPPHLDDQEMRLTDHSRLQGEHGHDLVTPRVDTMAVGGVADHTTYQLSLKFNIGSEQGDVDNIYTIYAI